MKYPPHNMRVLERAPRSPNLLLLKPRQVFGLIAVAAIAFAILGFLAGRASASVPGSHVSWASWYGPGLYGNHLGCGGNLGHGTWGVAHKSLPCGTRLVVCYRHYCTRVRVIDRGPYVAGRDFDLTAAVAQHLRFHGAQPIRWWVARRQWH
jgi:rare lipoprotein A (peptidoglycan hydrolase)